MASTSPLGCSWHSELTSLVPCTIFAGKFEVLARANGVSVAESPSLLSKWRAGNHEALQALIPVVYEELRRIARHHLRQERPDHTLQRTALVHEAYLRLVKKGPTDIENRAHFLAMASQLMRQILVDHARRYRAAKRGGGFKLELTEAMAMQKAPNVDLIALDNALNELARLDPQQSRIVEMRFFAGLSIEDTAEVIGISRTTVKREWATARAWLLREMSRREARA
jgi:RNA polymerase sigma factor (TIGR02999 family)